MHFNIRTIAESLRKDMGKFMPDIPPFKTKNTFDFTNLYGGGLSNDPYDAWDDHIDHQCLGRGHFLVCSLRIKNIPSDMDAHQLYNILKNFPYLEGLIDIKIPEKECQKNNQDIDFEMEEQIKKESHLASLIKCLGIDEKFNVVPNLFRKLDRDEKGLKLKFEGYSCLEEKKFSEKIKDSTYIRAGLNSLDCDDFTQDLWNLYEGKFSLRNYQLEKSFYDKSALVTVLGWTRVLKWRYNNRDINHFPTDYLGGKKKTSRSKTSQYKKVQDKKQLKCEKIEFGVFDPRDSEIFCPDLDVSKITQSMYLHFLPSASEKIQVLFEIPQLRKFAKVEFTYLECQKVYCKKNLDQTTLFFQLSGSAKYFIAGYNENYYQSLLYCHNWERMPNFTVNSQTDCQLLRTYKTENPVIKVTFPQSNSDLLESTLKAQGVKFRQNQYLLSWSKPVKSPYLTQNLLLESKRLSFESKYALLSCLTQRQINLFDITKSFFKRLELEESPIVEKTLKDIAKKSFETHPQDITALKENFEEFFWKLYQENELSKPLWEKSGELENIAKIKRVIFTPTSTFYHTEEPEQSNPILRRYKSQEQNFLRVIFQEDGKDLKYLSNKKFKALLKKFEIFDKSYTFLAYSASQLKNNSAWMISEQGYCNVKNIHAEIGDLSGIKNPAKRAARFGQLFSSSFKALELNDNISIQRIRDFKDINNKYTFSDGVGKISMNLMDQIKINLKTKDAFSAIQIRYAGVKGILVSDPSLASNTICLRNSMIKFESSTFDKTLEVLDYSKHRIGYLNRQIVLLLLSNGVSPQVFRELQNENIRDLEKKDHNIFSYAGHNQGHYSLTKNLIKDCLDSGVNITQEPFVKSIIEMIKIQSFMNLKDKSKILVKNSVRLTGVIDESGILEYGQIYLCISPSNGRAKNDLQVIKFDKVVVTKNPCLHPGDIRVLEAVDNYSTRKHFQHLINVVVFPSKGPRPHTDEMAGSDLDGDMYFVSWDPRLIPPVILHPMSYEARALKNRDANIEDMIDFFIEFQNNDNLGKIDNLHMARADSSDQLARDPNCLHLAELHAVAVDYAKSGIHAPFKEKDSRRKRQAVGSWENIADDPRIWPDYMQKDPEQSYQSNNVIGELYRQVVSKIESNPVFSQGKVQIDSEMIEAGFEVYLKKALIALDEYYRTMPNFFKIYGMKTEYEIFSSKYLKTEAGKKEHNQKKIQQKLNGHMQYIKHTLNQILDIPEQENDIEGYSTEMCQIVSALYVVSYYTSPTNSGNEDIDAIMVLNRYLEKLEKIRSRYKNAQLIGLPWFFFKDILLHIKRKNSR